MSKREDGGPAFPSPTERDPSNGTFIAPGYVGMTLRDWFAGQALSGMLADDDGYSSTSKMSATAYTIADAMLEAREADL